MSRMWVACTSVNENGSAMSDVRASGRSSDARMVAITASSMSIALSRPSTMWARLRAFSSRNSERRRDHLDLVVDVVRQRLRQVERARHAVHQRQHVDAEAGLQRRLLEEVVEDDVGVGVALQLDHQPRLLVGRRVAQLADPVEVPRPHQLGDLLLDHLHRRLVRQLGHHDAIADAALLDLGDGAHLDRTAARPVRVEDALAAEDLRPGREVGALHELPSARRGWPRGGAARGWRRRSPRPCCAAGRWSPCRRRCPGTR